ncbi:MAG: M23 family metallopeptidase [Saprospiraceae bacterium]|nr:M23 family metallopeptidase [Saprospiraceae bacterium]
MYFQMLLWAFLLLTPPLRGQSPVEVKWKEDPKTGQVVYTASCTSPGLYSIEVDVQMKGLQSDHPLPLRVVKWGPFEPTEILRLTPKNQSVGYSSRSMYTISQGDIWNVHPDTEQIYWLPMEPHRDVLISQGFKGRGSHRGDYAIDLTVPQGTPVTAARGGWVIDLKEDNDRGCSSMRCMKYANYILIQHADGTIGNYVHLQQDGALVDIGDQVVAGQLIGKSGNTGWSSGPHLHFDVSIPAGLNRRTIPFQILDPSGKAVTPKEGIPYSRPDPAVIDH